MILLSSADFNVDEVEIRKVQLSDSLSKDSVRSVQLFENYMYLICIWFGHGGRGGGAGPNKGHPSTILGQNVFFLIIICPFFASTRRQICKSVCGCSQYKECDLLITGYPLCWLPHLRCFSSGGLLYWDEIFYKWKDTWLA